MSERTEFVRFGDQSGMKMSALCRRFGISRKTGYKWLKRVREEGATGLANRSRRPKRQPGRTELTMVERILQERDQHPVWGGRKLRRRLQVLGHANVPAASTITEILRRHGRLNPEESQKHQAYQRFEHASPNDLWQMDFKGHFGLRSGDRCHPLTVLDDHSRFAVGVRACTDERGETVRSELTRLFQCYGLPRRMLMDNGSPWGIAKATDRFTRLEVWLMRLGIGITHGRPYHPQTQGKDERFHRTLKAELLQWNEFADARTAQQGFDQFRADYNEIRPHESLGMQVPAQRYEPSRREYPQSLPEIDYGPGVEVRRVQEGGDVHFRGSVYGIGKGLRGHPVGLKASLEDGVWNVYFCQHLIAQIDDRTKTVKKATTTDESACPASGRYAPCGLASHLNVAPNKT